MRRVVIVGAGGHGREQRGLVEALAAAGAAVRVEGYVVDPGYAPPGERVGDRAVLGGLDWLERHRDSVSVVCAIGDPAARLRMVERLRGIGVRFESLVHPAASVADSARLGEGALVSADAVSELAQSFGVVATDMGSTDKELHLSVALENFARF